MKMAPDISDPRRDRASFAAAGVFVGIVVAVALVVLFAALAWVNGCKSDDTDGALAACSAIQRNTLAIGPAVILFLGGAGAFVRTYQVWRANRGWWIWQGAGWFLLVLMMLMLTMTAPIALL